MSSKPIWSVLIYNLISCTLCTTYPALETENFILVDKVGFTFDEANTYCLDTYQTTLTSINSGDENSIVAGLIQQTTSACSNAHIGLQFINYQFSWIDGTSIDYIREIAETGTGKECVHIGGSGGWWLAFCDLSWDNVCFVCNAHTQNDEVPPTTSSPTSTYSPTTTQTKVYSTQQTMNDMKEVRYNAVCSNLVGNYDLKYETTLEECIAICENMGDLCRMINFYRYFKSVDDSRCYIFKGICNIVAVHNNETDQSSILYYKVNDDDLCVNYPTDWVDDIDDNCDAYFMYDWCNNGTIKRHENDFYELMNHGLDAMDTCCECGGGINIVDDIAVSVDTYWIDYDTDILCSVSLQNIKSTSRDWDNLYLYHFCESVQQINCAYLLNTNFNPTNYSYSIYLCNNLQNEDKKEIEFIMNQQINDDHLSHDTYVNLQWFNINATSYSSNISVIYLNYSECIHSLLYIDSNNTNNHGIHPCYSLDTDLAANNTTNEPATIAPDSTTNAPGSTTKVPDSTTETPEVHTTHHLTVSSKSDIVEVPPYENMSQSEAGTVVVIIITILSLFLLIACITIVFLRRKLNVVEMKDNMTEEGDNYNEEQKVEPSAPVLDGNDTKNEGI